MAIRRNAQSVIIGLLVSMLLTTAVFAAEGPAPAGDIQKGTITGKVMIKDGGPLSGGQVLFYDSRSGPPPMPYKYERTPDLARDLDAEGRFSVELRPGKYYLGVIRRLSGERMGPPRPGDFVFRDLDDSGARREYILKSGETMDVGTIVAAPLEKDKLLSQADTSVQGRVTGREGEPVANAVVAAFVTPALRGRPLFVSERTGEDGHYILRVPPGTYYLRVRNAFSSGVPEPGQIVGYFGEGNPEPVTVKKGEDRTGVNLKVILFPGRGPFTETAPSTKKGGTP